MDEFYTRMNVRNTSKREVANYILDSLNDEKTLVFDLGAGTCVIDQMLLENGFKGKIIAIDHNKQNIIKHPNLLFICDDLIFVLADVLPFVKQCSNVVIILSAILHELSKKDLSDLAALIKVINRFTCVHMIIREPAITNALIRSTFTVNEIVEEEDFKTYKSLHKHNKWSNQIAFINYCFVKSYGENSWEREKNEGRFTFTYKEILSFISKCGCKLVGAIFEKDEFYKDTLPYDMYQKISYTGTLIVSRRKRK